MNDSMKLSQAEIDALLNREAPAFDPNRAEPVLSDEDKDALGEIGNISFGSAATSLSALLQQRVEITTPSVSVLRSDKVENDLSEPYVMVTVEFTSGLTGANALAVQIDDAKTIADLMLGGDGKNVAEELNDLHLSAVAEAMNQMMGGAATSLSSMLGFPINISPPTVKFIDFSAGDELELGNPEWLVRTSFRLKVGNLIDSKIMQLVPMQFANELLGVLRAGVESAAAAPVAAQSPSRQPVSTPASRQVDAPMLNSRTAGAGTTGMPESMTQPALHAVTPPQSETTRPAMSMTASDVTVRRPEFTDFGAADETHAAPRNLSLLFDVALNVTVELGRTHKSIREILDLSPGSVIELQKLAGEPVDILVNNKRIAIGEVVVIDENFGVRVTDIISPVERVRNLQ